MKKIVLYGILAIVCIYIGLLAVAFGVQLQTDIKEGFWDTIVGDMLIMVTGILILFGCFGGVIALLVGLLEEFDKRNKRR